MRVIKLSILICISLIFSGCATQSFNLLERDQAYDQPLVEGAAKIIISNFDDLRREKTMVGRVGLSYAQVNASVTSELTDAIALELSQEGFTLQKLQVPKSNQDEIIKALKNNEAEFLLTGELKYFYFWSLDALVKSAKGQVDFLIEVFNTNGVKVFSKQYSAQAKEWIGFSPRDKYIALLKQMIDASVTELFQDREFIRILGPADKNSKLIFGIERVTRLHSSGALSDQEFNKAKARLLE